VIIIGHCLPGKNERVKTKNNTFKIMKSHKFFNKNQKELVYLNCMSILFIFLMSVLLIFTGCSLFTGNIAGGSRDRDAEARGLLPSFSGSYIEFEDVNGGDTYPGEDLIVYVNIINSGGAEARDVKVNLVADEFFKLNEENGEEICWNVDSIGAGEKVRFNTRLTLKDNITEDTMVSCSLKIDSGRTDSFIGTDYSTMVYGVKPFEGNFIAIIGLHAIEDHIGAPIELYTGHFEELCRVLKEYGYETITFMDLLKYVDFGKALPEKPVMITSDDGFQDVYTNGFPVLKRYGYKMTVFLVTGAIGETEASRKTNAYFNKRTNVIRPILIWPEIEEMHEYGCEFLSHTVNHVRLGLVSDGEFLYELKKSKEDIESHLGSEVLFFAWPYDNNSPSKWHLIPEAGYRGAVRYGTGIEDMRTINLYDIDRVEFNSYIPPAQYVGYLNLDRSIKIEFRIDNEYKSGKYVKEAGEEFMLEYLINNTNDNAVKISSLELELPENIELIEVDSGGYINQYPGINSNIYMWVSDSYTIAGNGRINLILKLKGKAPGESIIKFRTTYKGYYINCDGVKVEIKSKV